MNTETDGKKKGKKLIYIFAGFFAILLVATAIYTTGAFAQESDGMCGPLPENSLFANIDAGKYDMTDNEGNLLEGRALINRGITIGKSNKSVVDNRNDFVPDCFSNDPGLQTLYGLNLTDEDGKVIPCIKCVGTIIGSETPLP